MAVLGQPNFTLGGSLWRRTYDVGSAAYNGKMLEALGDGLS
jgi:hypothetical protein